MSLAADSGGGGFLVNPSTLEATAKALGGLGTELSALCKVPSAGSAVAFGGGKVESTVTDFFHTWNYAISQMNGDLTNLIKNLQQAAANYTTADACVASGATNG
jgi:uncharacterized protein YukE